MKKTLFLSGLLALGLVCPAFALNKADKEYKCISNNGQIVEAVKLIKESPAKNTYRRLMGNNQTQKPVRIKFKRLSALGRQYTNAESVGKVKLNGFNIYINKKYKDTKKVKGAPPETLAALIAGMSVHSDDKNSINEETYGWALEAVLWDYFTRQNPEIKNYKSSLTDRENAILELYKKSPKDAKYVVKSVRKTRSPIRYQWTSAGFNHSEYADKMDKLFVEYSNIQAMPAKIKVQTVQSVPVETNIVPVSDVKKDEAMAPAGDTVNAPGIEPRLYDIIQE